MTGNLKGSFKVHQPVLKDLYKKKKSIATILVSITVDKTDAIMEFRKSFL